MRSFRARIVTSVRVPPQRVGGQSQMSAGAHRPSGSSFKFVALGRFLLAACGREVLVDWLGEDRNQRQESVPATANPGPRGAERHDVRDWLVGRAFGRRQARAKPIHNRTDLPAVRTVVLRSGARRKCPRTSGRLEVGHDRDRAARRPDLSSRRTSAQRSHRRRGSGWSLSQRCRSVRAMRTEAEQARTLSERHSPRAVHAPAAGGRP